MRFVRGTGCRYPASKVTEKGSAECAAGNLRLGNLPLPRMYCTCLQRVLGSAEMETVMSFDQTCGHQALEPAEGVSSLVGLAAAGEYSRASSAIALAAACAAHGCCDEENEEGERWDGMG